MKERLNVVVEKKPFVFCHSEKPDEGLNAIDWIAYKSMKKGDIILSENGNDKKDEIYSVRKNANYTLCEQVNGKIKLAGIVEQFRFKFMAKVNLEFVDFAGAGKFIKKILSDAQYSTHLAKERILHLSWDNSQLRKLLNKAILMKFESLLSEKLKSIKTKKSIEDISDKILRDTSFNFTEIVFGCQVSFEFKWLRIHHDDKENYDVAISQRAEKTAEKKTQQSEKTVFEKVCLVFVDGKMMGNGFSVGKYIVTCWHILFDDFEAKRGKNITVNFGENSLTSKKATILKKSKELDIALLGVESAVLPGLQLEDVSISRTSVTIFRKRENPEDKRARTDTVKTTTCEGVYEKKNGEACLISRCKECSEKGFRESFFELCGPGMFGDSGSPVLKGKKVCAMISHAAKWRNEEDSTIEAKIPRVLKANAIIRFIEDYENPKKTSD